MEKICRRDASWSFRAERGIVVERCCVGVGVEVLFVGLVWMMEKYSFWSWSRMSRTLYTWQTAEDAVVVIFLLPPAADPANGSLLSAASEASPQD